MSTEIISLKDCRKNFSQLWKRAQKENIQFIVMVHSEPVIKITPIEKPKNKYSYSLKDLNATWLEKLTPMTSEEVWYVSDEEQAEIEEILKNPECWEYWSSETLTVKI